MTITDDFEVFADNYHKQNGTHNPLKVPYIKVKETNDKLIYYDKKNDKFIWEFKLNLAHLPQDIEEDIGRMITSYKMKDKVFRLRNYDHQTRFIQSYELVNHIRWRGNGNFKKDRRNFINRLVKNGYCCRYPLKNGEFCESATWGGNGKILPDKYQGLLGGKGAGWVYPGRSFCKRHEKLKDFSWDKYFEAHGYKLRNGVVCKVCKD
jgi:hypothetical protein